MINSQLSAKDRVVQAAYELYYQKGIQNVGLKEVAEVAGVAYMSLYNNFKSKDDLIVAALEHRISRHRVWLEAIFKETKTSKATLLRILERQEDWLRVNETRGCTLINASVELANSSHPAHQLTRRYKEEVRQVFEKLAKDAKLKNPAALSHQLMLLMDGSNVTAVVRSDPSVAKYAYQAAKILVETATHTKAKKQGGAS
jgi:AcrR family transcriptional regulator